MRHVVFVLSKVCLLIELGDLREGSGDPNVVFSDLLSSLCFS